MTVMAAEDRLAALIAEVERYLSNPGCNANARATAFRRLAWALEQAQNEDNSTHDR